jgi:uncharacterized membrane protein HdeD (DUF308 family)
MEHDGQITTERILSGVWKFFATRGAVALAFGLVLLGWPNVGLSLMVALVGAFALANGLVSGAAAFAVPAGSGRHRLWLALDALAGVAIGVIVLVGPDLSAIALLYLIAVWAIAIGAVQLAGALLLPLGAARSLLLALNGIVLGAFGMVMFAAPGEGAVAPLALIAAFSLVNGAFDIALALDLRRALEQIKRRVEPTRRPRPIAHG